MDAERVCIFVDGENLRHTICDLFPTNFDQDDYLPKLAQWESFFDLLVNNASVGGRGIRIRTYWYVIEDVDFFPYKLPKPDRDLDTLVAVLKKYKDYKKTLNKLTGVALKDKATELRQELIDEQNRIISKFRGWENIQDGITNKHSAIEFRRSGHIRYNLFTHILSKEKAVDVKLATDLILLSDIYDTAVIVSGDQDFVPAVEAIKDRGKRVVNVAFLERSGKLLPGGARRLNQVTDTHISISHEDSARYFKI